MSHVDGLIPREAYRSSGFAPPFQAWHGAGVQIFCGHRIDAPDSLAFLTQRGEVDTGPHEVEHRAMMLTTLDRCSEGRVKHASRNAEIAGPFVPVASILDQRFVDAEKHGLCSHRASRALRGKFAVFSNSGNRCPLGYLPGGNISHHRDIAFRTAAIPKECPFPLGHGTSPIVD